MWKPWWWKPWEIVPERRERFLEGRQPMSDMEFMRGVACPEDQSRVVLAIRNTIAMICSVDAYLLHPSDDPEELRLMMDWGIKHGWILDIHYGTFDSWEFKAFLYKQVDDDFEIVMSRSEFEDHLPPFGKARGRLWKGPDPTTFGEWAAHSANVITKWIEQPWPE